MSACLPFSVCLSLKTASLNWTRQLAGKIIAVRDNLPGVEGAGRRGSTERAKRCPRGVRSRCCLSNVQSRAPPRDQQG